MSFPPGNGRERGGEYGVRTPAEGRRYEQAGRAQDVINPTLQACIVALFGASALFWAVIVARAIGATAFWLGVLVVAITSALWFSLQASRWRNGAIEELSGIVVDDVSAFDLAYQYRAVHLLDIVASWLLAATVGGIGLALHRVAALAFPSWPIKSPGWNFLTVLPLLFSIIVVVLVGGSFVQRLWLPGLFQRQYLWQNFSEWLFGWKLRKPVAPREPMVIRDRGPKVPALMETEPMPLAVEMAPEERQYANLREFIERGATERVNGNYRGFARNEWVGIKFATGDVMTDPMWRGFTGWLKSAGWMSSSRAGTILTASSSEVLAGLEPPQVERRER